MKCPHCLISFHSSPRHKHLQADRSLSWGIIHEICPACREIIIWTASKPIEKPYDQEVHYYQSDNLVLVHPLSRSRPAPSEVPPEIKRDFEESALIIDLSPKASAALSRRCLQAILERDAGVKHGNLNNEIDELLAKKILPSHIAVNLDAVRIIGNFSAHPIKSTSSGEIVDVEPDEAEWNLEVIESLFDYYYVHPAKSAERNRLMNEKLVDAGKPPLKSGS
jgi:hypothetical protein